MERSVPNSICPLASFVINAWISAQKRLSIKAVILSWRLPIKPRLLSSLSPLTSHSQIAVKTLDVFRVIMCFFEGYTTIVATVNLYAEC
ncbi:MAG: hypothetical protein NWE92_08795 [Candidatus Bathyarchaeota archaeon]|nr:hypothetical protein [Candidatus Bathyarchaeota archaeon]